MRLSNTLGLLACLAPTPSPMSDQKAASSRGPAGAGALVATRFRKKLSCACELCTTRPLLGVQEVCNIYAIIGHSRNFLGQVTLLSVPGSDRQEYNLSSVHRNQAEHTNRQLKTDLGRYNCSRSVVVRAP